MKSCRTCGGPVNRVGNYYVCEYCRNKWEIDSGNDVHAVDRANAWAALRDGDFEKSAELFENIIVKESKNHEAYWGRALALAGIIYVADMNENKKVPTCNNITEESFINNKDVQKAISLAPADIADGYKQQAEYIEKVRIEWLGKASKEPAYDVFISFKDSDRENGIERTQDSIDAQDLYNALVAEGYKVFFSRISLRDKISEQYEPYIYNAINTAKVMIVFGEKAEYFSSAWIKNEWSRFKTRIEKGEKHKNSLVVVYKNMNPGDLPAILKSRQCLNAADMTFLSDLTRHIKRVIAETTNIVRLDRLEIVGGQRSVRATKIRTNTIQVKTLGEGLSPELSITEKQTLSLAKTYLAHDDFEKAQKLAEDILFDNPGNSEAIYLAFLAKHQAKSEKDFAQKTDFNDYAGLHKVLGILDVSKAESLLQVFYEMRQMPDGKYAKLLHEIIPYATSKREKYIANLFEYTLQQQAPKCFEEILQTIPENDVDTYINRLFDFASSLSTQNDPAAYTYITKILECDTGCLRALRLRVELDVKIEEDINKINSHIQEYLQYTENVNASLLDVLNVILSMNATMTLETACRQTLKYYSGLLSSLENQLLNIAFWAIEGRLFVQAEYYLRLILGFNKGNYLVYKALCMIRAGATEWHLMSRVKFDLSELPELDKYLAMCSKAEREDFFKIQHKNKINFQIKKHAILSMHQTIDQGIYVRYIIGADGRLHSPWNKPIPPELAAWNNIVSIHRSGRSEEGVGDVFFCLCADGTVKTNSLAMNIKVSRWRNIVQIAVEKFLILGLCSDGSCCITFWHEPDNISVIVAEIASWKNIIQIAIRSDKFLALDSDGVAHYICTKEFDGIIERTSIFTESNIAALYYGDYNTPCTLKYDDGLELVTISGPFALAVDGTVGVLRKDYVTIDRYKELKNWKNVIAITSTGTDVTGLCEDGTVYSTSCRSKGIHDIAELLEPDHMISKSGVLVKKGELLNISCRKKPKLNTWAELNAYEKEIWNPKPVDNAVQGTTNGKTSGGCYIATCIYGSYDCSPVWVLRRYRDQHLMTTKVGRLFVKFYYATSPFLVQKFGSNKWFRSIWKTLLDKFVSKLESAGIKDSPYQDV